ncbi:hypothetical protein SAMN02910263_03942 [Butyrivibrio sp. INlla16]|nr:hypothetical protein SAMN02910263_03942 [Butyrivibrio sp. INlla16]
MDNHIRSSNFELLRIVLMFGIILSHFMSSPDGTLILSMVAHPDDIRITILEKIIIQLGGIRK